MKLSLVEWLEEREANCRRHAARNYGAEKAGWIEDAEYFKQAVALAAPLMSPASTGGGSDTSEVGDADDELRRVLAALPWREVEAAPGVYTRYVHQGAMLDAIDQYRTTIRRTT